MRREKIRLKQMRNDSSGFLIDVTDLIQQPKMIML